MTASMEHAELWWSGQSGKMTYHYLKSTKGNCGVYLDGTFRQTINYKGSVGKLREPEKKSLSGSFSGLPGVTSQLRNMRGAVYGTASAWRAPARARNRARDREQPRATALR